MSRYSIEDQQCVPWADGPSILMNSEPEMATPTMIPGLSEVLEGPVRTAQSARWLSIDRPAIGALLGHITAGFVGCSSLTPTPSP